MTNAAYIFDLDGTLYPYNLAYREACRMSVETSGNAFSGIFNLMDNYNAHDSAVNFAKTHGLHETSRRMPEAQTKILKKARKALSPNFLIPDSSLIQSLEHARDADIPLYIFTHSEKAWTDKALQALKLDLFFSEQNRITRDNDLGPKSDAQSFQRLLKKISLPAGTQIILFDDSDKNKMAAETAGLEFSKVDNFSGVSPDFINAVTDTIIENRTRTAPHFEP